MDMKITRLLTIFITGLMLYVVMPVSAQSFEDVKDDPSYVWGQGSSETLQSADDAAVKDLVSQISVNVNNEIETTISNEQANGEATSSVSTTGNLRVSSSVQLSNCKRLVKEENGFFIVLRYVAREEIDKMFDARKAKIDDLISAAERAEEHYKVGDDDFHSGGATQSYDGRDRWFVDDRDP